VAIFVSNLPEAIGSATDMKSAGKRSQTIMAGWAIVAFVCALATVGGHALSRVVGARFTGVVDGFAAGTTGDIGGFDDPRGKGEGGHGRGLAAVIGYAVAAGLSVIS
jgi:ZIP family zinc transporter